jgi:iron complex outermembrane recepter protein
MRHLDRFSSISRCALCAALIVSATGGASTAYGQAAAPVDNPNSPAVARQDGGDNPSVLPPERSDSSSDDIVVTGTLIRGIAPAGSNVIGVASPQILATGATTTKELLATIPQIGNAFGTVPQPGGSTGNSNTVVPIFRPTLRNLPGGNSSGGATTLVLIDGHRVVGAGLGQVAVDPDVVPPGALERVEAITDGGSAIYGSDAIGGVINFITLRRFDGVKVAGRYGFADDYETVDADVTVGRDWGSGSVFVSYHFADSDPIFGRDRDYIRAVDWSTGVPIGRQCDLPNVSTVGGSRTFASPGFALGTVNACDTSDDTTLLVSNRQHNVLAGLTQQLSDAISFDVRAFYANRYSEGTTGPLRATATVNSTNPNYRPLPGADAGRPQAVAFSFAPVLGDNTLKTRTRLESWNVTPSFSFDLGSGWKLRTLFNYGESTTQYDNPQAFTTNINAAVAAGTLNPYNVAASSPAAVAAAVGNNLGTAWHQFTSYRAVLDGTLLTLPGGDVAVAVGGEHFNTRYTVQQTNTTNFTPLARLGYTQKVSSLFGEVQLPIFGSENGFVGMSELRLSASGRYDKYNDFGSTFNPKLGLTYKPVEWVSLFGNWGKSFSAPTPTDQLGVSAAQSLVQMGQPSNFPNGATLNPALLPGQTTYSFVLLRGAVADLKPQTAKTWSVGARVTPPFIPGLTLSGTYYNIRFNNAITSPNQSADTQIFFRQFPSLVTVDPTPAQLLAAAQQVNGGVANLATIPAGGRVVALYDIRARNLGAYHIEGLDFSANYTTETGFGSVDASFSGNYLLKLTAQTEPGLPVTDTLAFDSTRLRLVGTLGVNVGNVRAQLTWNHSGGFKTVRSAARLQDRVSNFDVFNLFLRYDVPGNGLAQDLQFTLNVNNLLDRDPPVFRDRTSNGFTNGQTIGRVVLLGANKKF